MKAVAIKKNSREKVEGLQEMGTLRCDVCGEELGCRPMESGMGAERVGDFADLSSIRGYERRYTRTATRAVFRKGAKPLETVQISARKPEA